MVKKIISGQIYDTETATRVHHFARLIKSLIIFVVMIRHGAFFLWEHDGKLVMGR